MSYFPPTGSVVAFQSDPTKLQVTASVAGAVSVTNPISSVVALITSIPSISGTVNAIQSGPWSTSIVGVIPGSVVAFQGTVPWTVNSIYGNISGSVVAFISGNPSISGTVQAIQSGAWSTSLVGTIPGSVVAFQGAGWSGSVAATITNTNINVSGSVVGFQGGTQISSISGTVVIQSVVGTYSDGATRSVGSSGIYNLGVRNDTMASIVASDGQYTPMAIGPSGENIVANAPLTKWVQGIASCFTGVSQPVIAAQGASIFTYITAVQAVNNSANNAYLTFFGANSSTIGYLPVPANGGAIANIPNAWKTSANGAFSASVSGVASVFLSSSGFISKT